MLARSTSNLRLVLKLPAAERAVKDRLIEKAHALVSIRHPDGHIEHALLGHVEEWLGYVVESRTKVRAARAKLHRMAAAFTEKRHCEFRRLTDRRSAASRASAASGPSEARDNESAGTPC